MSVTRFKPGLSSIGAPVCVEDPKGDFVLFIDYEKDKDRGIGSLLVAETAAQPEATHEDEPPVSAASESEPAKHSNWFTK